MTMPTPTSATDPSFPLPHPQYYIQGADLNIIAGGTLFRVHSYFLTRESTTFHRRVHPVSPGSAREGTDQDPVLLQNVTAEEFETFLWVFYNPRYSIYDASVEKWKTILRLANQWGFQEVKELAVRELHRRPELGLIDRLVLYQEHQVDDRHLIPLFAELCARPEPLSLGEATMLGLETTVFIAAARETLRGLPQNHGLSQLNIGAVTQYLETHTPGPQRGSPSPTDPNTNPNTNPQNPSQGRNPKQPPRGGPSSRRS